MTEQKTVFVLLPFESGERKRLQQVMPDCTFYYKENAPLTDEQMEQVQVILGNPDQATINRCPNLKWVQLGSAGADAFVKEGVLPSGTKLTNATGAYGLAISEYMMAGALMLFKKMHLYRDQQSSGVWKSLGEVRSIMGAQVLSVGMGDIGSAFAFRMHNMGAQVTGIRRTASSCPEYVEAVYQMEELDRLLPEMDIVALSLPNSAETRGLFSKQRLALMKKDSILLNVGRGSAVDTEALYDALASEHLGGALLDVTEPEPLPADHPIWKQPNAIITPHVSGGYHLKATYYQIAEICAENLKRFYSDEDLTNQVDFATGYRKRSE